MSFDRLAPYYRTLECVLAGGTLQRMRTRWLPAIAGASEILIVGEGHGRGIEAVRRTAPTANITVVEQSPRMIAVARARLRRRSIDASRIEFVCADVCHGPMPRGRFDVIVTQFFLDCFAPATLAAVVARLAAAARPDAQWLLCDFQIPQHGWRRARARVIHALMYAFFRRVTGLEARHWTSPDACLRRAGFELDRRWVACGGLLHTDVWLRGSARRRGYVAGFKRHLQEQQQIRVGVDAVG